MTGPSDKNRRCCRGLLDAAAGLLGRLGVKRYAPRKVTHFNLRDETDAGLVLDYCLRQVVQQRPGRVVVLLGPDNEIARILRATADRLGLETSRMDVGRADPRALPPAEKVAMVACTSVSADEAMRAADEIRRTPLADVPFEAALVPHAQYPQLLAQDSQSDSDFISPLLLLDVDVQDIYRRSLERFEKKCQIRDFLDLCQALHSLVDRDVPGDIAEFGSFRGHSGYLIARVLEAFGSDKTVHLFDTFDHFPAETGIDGFWSHTHPVSYEQVREKFHDLPHVRFVRGDFTETLDQAGIEQLALAYVDCDSYRGTRFLAESIFETVLAPGGLMIFEDYGHAPLIGNRLAVHEFFDGRDDCFRWFSQFSGFYMVLKPGGSSTGRG